MGILCYNMPKFSYVLFDLDGTLIETGPGITKSLQFALEKMGKPGEAREKLEKFIGPPLEKSFPKFYGFDEEQTKQAMQFYEERYTPTGIYESNLYPGVQELLDALKKAGIPMGVCTSKPADYCDILLKYHKIEDYFSIRATATRDGKRSAKKDVLAYGISLIGNDSVSKAHPVAMVGDATSDFEAAEATPNVVSVSVSWGYGDSKRLKRDSEYFAEKMEDLKRILLK